MSKQMKLRLSLLSRLLNHSTTEVFFHWLMLSAAVIFSFILSSMVFLILPISDFVGLIRRQVALFAKFGLWSLSVTKASFLAVVSILSLILSEQAVAFSLHCSSFTTEAGHFLWDYVMLFSNNWLYF